MSHDWQPGGHEMTLPNLDTETDLDESLMGLPWHSPFLLKKPMSQVIQPRESHSKQLASAQGVQDDPLG